ncbi:uncharacterized protein LOC125499685 [Athalia rosae]|uniref:uncharacterized protein LOC125499685 n=1 Tax=Athalia rosae TaxID=37344 RepID=UPI0020337FC2|nr:uncharacterized protein LOC125499685 [Athalia rosae]
MNTHVIAVKKSGSHGFENTLASEKYQQTITKNDPLTQINAEIIMKKKLSRAQPDWLETEDVDDENYGSGSDMDDGSNDTQINNTSRSESDSYSKSESATEGSVSNDQNNTKDPDNDSDENENFLLGKDKKTQWFDDPPN